ncbi:putative pyridoxal-dependent aspartate 1-decarboxylase [Catenovulum sp. 2E275]|uniref:pyridoxal-dependent aspartate 1-decarboxylase PanP n=1 Tax=Catenovulum sp. 2E275 TaxID=2980497 RepID=UPI0021D344A0|nr:putative pyridoxal-dependent aspartate 1-decarboxylase [Catenovulum sp. 2E275]MCU4675418.1 putative pyridoxal-dependent aspartate 1-decarboxylase [Catenovulum sp. 2E275]
MNKSITKVATADMESLYRIFTVAEAPDSTLGQIEKEISENLAGFLNEHIVARAVSLAEIERDFSCADMPEQPTFVSEHTQFLLDKLVANSVHTAAPSFIGHMTSALPYFMLPLSKIMIALNQNLVKIETSKAFTPLERQVLGIMHNLVFGQNEQFYQTYMHSESDSLGAFCSGGTLANITALWVARNNLLKANNQFKGVNREGMYRALNHYGYQGVAILVSNRGHYSLGKAADVLGIGRDDLIAVEVDATHKVLVDEMRTKAAELEEQGIKVMAIVGVAGTTETGNVDPLNDLADLAEQLSCHFHVDAAWGGATLFSKAHKALLKGIERADSVTIDAHKQMYVPMGAGIVLFKQPKLASEIEHHAEYVLRKGSKDLGSHTLEGSRPGMAMLVYSALKVLGRKGYELLINRSIKQAEYFAGLISQQADFELVSKPELCILTYRYVPQSVKALLAKADLNQQKRINEKLDDLTRFIQKCQREAGKSFVSRTRLTSNLYPEQTITVFRVVLANPLTTEQILQDVLAEQAELAQLSQFALPALKQILAESAR